MRTETANTSLDDYESIQPPLNEQSFVRVPIDFGSIQPLLNSQNLTQRLIDFESIQPLLNEESFVRVLFDFESIQPLLNLQSSTQRPWRTGSKSLSCSQPQHRTS
jgi:hypothetical protein